MSLKNCEFHENQCTRSYNFHNGVKAIFSYLIHFSSIVFTAQFFRIKNKAAEQSRVS
jgi:hypothetical protein